MKIVVTTSTFPMHPDDKIPDFVYQQLLALKKFDPEISFIVHAPYNYLSESSARDCGAFVRFYKESRFHYFLPRRLELVAGGGIMSTLRSKPWSAATLPFFLAFHLISLYLLVKKEKPEILYAHWFTPQAISSAIVSKLTATPFVFTTHASDVSVLGNIPFSKAMVRAVCRRASAYTAVSKKTSSKLKRFFTNLEWENEFKQKLAVIPMGIVMPNRRQKYPRDRGLTTILFLGRFVEKKGVDFLLKSVLMLSRSKDVRLVLAGNGPEFASYKNLVKEFGIESIVEFVGFVKDRRKEQLLLEADIVCIPSVDTSSGDEEGMPVVLMEALAVGAVVVATTSSGADEYLKDGFNGYLVPGGDHAALCQKLREVIDESPNRLSVVSYEAYNTSRLFDWELLVWSYRDLLGKRGLD
ncbi:glycosyltransferase [Litorivivens sp.]|uniref:glycosyltransferase n=1 Tax=Litorivivens sp. TaxID=2020868 RepID=UPI0035657F70